MWMMRSVQLLLFSSIICFTVLQLPFFTKCDDTITLQNLWNELQFNLRYTNPGCCSQQPYPYCQYVTKDVSNNILSLNIPGNVTNCFDGNLNSIFSFPLMTSLSIDNQNGIHGTLRITGAGLNDVEITRNGGLTGLVVPLAPSANVVITENGLQNINLVTILSISSLIVRDNHVLTDFSSGFTSITTADIKHNLFEDFFHIPLFFQTVPSWDANWDLGYNHWQCQHTLNPQCISTHMCSPCCVVDQDCVNVNNTLDVICNNNKNCEMTCTANYKDCNVDNEDGCETATNTLENCGNCGIICQNVINASIACNDSTCLYSCNSNHYNCNQTSNDCETYVVNSIPNQNNCESNGTCLVSNSCAVNIECIVDHIFCNGSCIAQDLNHCGACNNDCCTDGKCDQNTQVSCSSGHCGYVCNADFADCIPGGSLCDTSIATVSHCGNCTNECTLVLNASIDCIDHSCFFTCSNGMFDCDFTTADGCEYQATQAEINTSYPSATNISTLSQYSCRVNSSHYQVFSCPSTYGNCNSSLGCETDLTTTTNCGACGITCSPKPHSTPVCVDQKCALNCDIGYLDCNTDYSDGCEIDETSDPLHCGQCNKSCQFPNVLCKNSICTCDCSLGTLHLNRSNVNCISTGCDIAPGTADCLNGYANCDNDNFNGCELNVQSNSDNCGNCNISCNDKPNSHNGTCENGICLLDCADPFVDCNTDLNDGCETNLTTPSSCGNNCSSVVNCLSLNHVSSASCVDGECTILSCLFGFTLCSGECVILETAPFCETCPACAGIEHVTSYHCEYGICKFECQNDWDDCTAYPGCETNILNTLQHCGNCNNSCYESLPNVDSQCIGGNCSYSCLPHCSPCGLNITDVGCPINTSSNPSHCGSCESSCYYTHVNESSCSNGECNIISCEIGFDNCDSIIETGCETDIYTNISKCGGCDKECIPVQNIFEKLVCENGNCGTDQCPDGVLNCDGNDDCEHVNTDISCGCDEINCLEYQEFVASCNLITGQCEMDNCSFPFDNCIVGDESCSTNLSNDTNHCGSCENDCSKLPNSIALCSNSNCDIIDCSPNFRNCDGNITNGCEVDTLSDEQHCGDCNVNCTSLSNIKVVNCNSGSCEILECKDNFGNCNHEWSDGCESNLLLDNDNCQACSQNCSLLNNTLVTACNNGYCTINSCDPNFKNCDGNITNGCEVDTLSDEQHCGDCNVNCTSLPNIKVVNCNSGVCTIEQCDEEYSNCDQTKEGCETNLLDPHSCGSCNNTCYRHNVINATCIVDINQISQVDCIITNCEEGYEDCNSNYLDGCETPITTIQNCGTCNSTCKLDNAIPICLNYSCSVSECSFGFDNCDEINSNGCETDLSTINNCGMCDNECSSAANADVFCSKDLICEMICINNFADCDNITATGCEVDITSNNTCGGCKHDCTKLPGVQEVSCTEQFECNIISCQPMRAQCDTTDIGCSTNLSSNSRHCGTCENNCNILSNVEQVACRDGLCFIEVCHHGFADCNKNPDDGCETQLGRSISNCGACGTDCLTLNKTDATRIECTNGICNIYEACMNGYADCDLNIDNGCETALMTTTQNCGNCATNCTSLFESENVNLQTIQCQLGVCSFSQCNDNFLNCNQQIIDGCEVNIMTSVNHCGSCDINCFNLPNLKSANCDAGKCKILTCSNSHDDCNQIIDDGCEATLNTIETCGSCNNNCSSLSNVVEVQCLNGGVCSINECKPFTEDCNQLPFDGCESILLTDRNHCGDCFQNCQVLEHVAISDCNEGECIIIECNDEYGDCNQRSEDGCETQLSTLPENCGHCGMCGNDVVPLSVRSAICQQQQLNNENISQCVILECVDGFEDCNNNATDGCETITLQIPPGCGPCSANCPPSENNDNTENGNITPTDNIYSPPSVNQDTNVVNPPPTDDPHSGLDQHLQSDYFPSDVKAGEEVATNGNVFVVYKPNSLIDGHTSIQLETISSPLNAPDNAQFIASTVDITIDGRSNTSNSLPPSSVSIKLKDPIKICFAINITLTSKSKHDACLAYVNEKTNTWECEDQCLSYSSPSNNATWACGYSGHLTDFTVLFGGLASGGNCGNHHDDYILGNLENDSILIGSVAAAVVLCAIIVIVLYFTTPLENFFRGKEGTRIKLARSKISSGSAIGSDIV